MKKNFDPNDEWYTKFFIRDYKWFGLTLEQYLNDCHADNCPISDERITELWNADTTKPRTHYIHK